MARRRRRRRGYGGYVTIPGLGGMKDIVKKANPLGKSVRSTDVIVGAVIGLAGGTFMKMGIETLNTMLGGKIPEFILRYTNPLSTFLAGVAASMLQKNSTRGQGHLVGASAVAISGVAWNMLQEYGPKKADGTPLFREYVQIPFGILTPDAGGGMGILTPDAAMSGYGGYGEGEDDVFSAP